ncbi:hypothetical protein BV22DRAFT_824614 [Leucogyrophana mollusca]|uniref:Uncharacterized protein n=1 Tax=Leucogyrophana mollusca TaxID=85980 RepID=A0ACB8B4J9_9AGAM|nr:hypothetical protein BV22DRAFT_824614 [Leucogyrophana mollusca]
MYMRTSTHICTSSYPRQYPLPPHSSNLLLKYSHENNALPLSAQIPSTEPPPQERAGSTTRASGSASQCHLRWGWLAEGGRCVWGLFHVADPSRRVSRLLVGTKAGSAGNTPRTRSTHPRGTSGASISDTPRGSPRIQPPYMSAMMTLEHGTRACTPGTPAAPGRRRRRRSAGARGGRAGGR